MGVVALFRCGRCGAPARPVDLVRGGATIGSVSGCEKCVAEGVEEMANVQPIFDAMLAAGVPRADANAVMVFLSGRVNYRECVERAKKMKKPSPEDKLRVRWLTATNGREVHSRFPAFVREMARAIWMRHGIPEERYPVEMRRVLWLANRASVARHLARRARS